MSANSRAEGAIHSCVGLPGFEALATFVRRVAGRAARARGSGERVGSGRGEAVLVQNLSYLVGLWDAEILGGLEGEAKELGGGLAVPGGASL